MESKGVPTPARVYQDFEPSMEWVPEDDSDTLLVYLPGACFYLFIYYYIIRSMKFGYMMEVHYGVVSMMVFLCWFMVVPCTF